MRSAATRPGGPPPARSCSASSCSSSRRRWGAGAVALQVPARKISEHRPVADSAVAAAPRGLHRGGGQGPLLPSEDFSEARSILELANTVPDAIVEAPRWKTTGEPRLPGSPESVVRGEKRARKKKERGPLIVVRKQPLPLGVDPDDDGGIA